MVARRRPALAPIVAALLATTIVVLVVLVARAGRAPGPDSTPRMPVPLDVGGQSLDRCALALDAAGLAPAYPDRADWSPLAVQFTGDTFVTLLDGEVPFVCVTDPASVEVSDPRLAVPVDTAMLLLTTPAGVLAAVAPARETIKVAAIGVDSADVADATYFLDVTGTSITDASRLTTTITGPTGTRLRIPDRLAPPALRLIDRPWVSAVPSGTDDLLHRCRSAASGTEPPRPWQTAHVLTYRRGEHNATLLVAIGPGTVGGCSVDARGATPLRVWRIGTVSDGPRPFVWLPEAGDRLSDLDADIAAGPVEPGVVRMEITAGLGRSWNASVAGGTFATQIPDGVPHDPRVLSVRAFDAEDQLIYHGPAAG